MSSVLVVEDDADLRFLVTHALEARGHVVYGAADGVAAVELLVEHPVDALVIDVTLPRLDGFGVLLARRRRNLAPDARVLMLTGRTDERAQRRGWELGCDEFVLKPAEPYRLARVVDDLLDRTPAQRAIRRDAELQKAALLDQLEATLGPSTPGPPT